MLAGDEILEAIDLEISLWAGRMSSGKSRQRYPQAASEHAKWKRIRIALINLQAENRLLETALTRIVGGGPDAHDKILATLRD